MTAGRCVCAPSARRWDPVTTRCSVCCNLPLEAQLVPVLLQILCGGTGLALWRNSNGYDAERRVRYGLGPGSGDYVGLHRGRWVEVEFKTSVGRLSKEQQTRRALIARLNGVYAVVRSEADARALLTQLGAAGHTNPLPPPG